MDIQSPRASSAVDLPGMPLFLLGQAAWGPHRGSGILPGSSSKPVGAKCDSSLARSSLRPVNPNTLRPK